ncbi:hypothetical protein M3Y99_00926500 [Aphelenchoides fujianensis]|nr:hypothetical protein M3Y99_00926500 [Aphelenchoides fujianensis]
MNAANSRPQKISVLFSPFDVPLACKMSTTECEGMAEKTGQLAILPHSSTDLLKSFAHFQLPTTRMCLDNAVAVILTDIPCSSYKDYPDVNGLLGDDRLLETIKTFNTEFKLHTVIAYLSPNASYPKTEACTNLKQHKFDPRADFLEFEFLNYEQLDGKICDKPILYPRNNTLPVPPRLGTPWIEIMVIAGIVFVGVVVLCCGAGLVYCFCKECKKRRNLS